MNQLESDGLSIMARAWLLIAETKPDDEARGIRRCAAELREWLQHCDTAPGAPPEGEPMQLPPMGAPRVPTFPEEA